MLFYCPNLSLFYGKSAYFSVLFCLFPIKFDQNEYSLNLKALSQTNMQTLFVIWSWGSTWGLKTKAFLDILPQRTDTLNFLVSSLSIFFALHIWRRVEHVPMGFTAAPNSEWSKIITMILNVILNVNI